MVMEPLIVHRFTEPLPQPVLRPAHEAHGSDVVVLFYHYGHVPDAAGHRVWQERLCSQLRLLGKLRVANEGVNGTLSGSAADIDAYVATLLQHPQFADMKVDEFKRSLGRAEENFVTLSVKLVDEIIFLGAEADVSRPQAGGAHLSPRDFHQLVSTDNAGDILLLDCRNHYESKIVCATSGKTVATNTPSHGC